MLDERALKRMPPAKAFDRRDARAFHLRDRHEARVHRLAVDEHRARAALAFAASFLGAGQPAVLAQHVEQTLHRMRRRRVIALPLTVRRMRHALPTSPCRHDLLRRRRNLAHVDARVPERVDDRGRRAVDRHLADAFRAERPVLVRVLENRRSSSAACRASSG